MPEWISILADASLIAAALSAIAITIDLVAGHKQKMWIMNVVWPITALYAGPLGLWAYYRFGRMSKRGNPGKTKPFWQITAVAATHCGAGCTLGDLIAEWITFAVPISLFGEKILGAWALDFGAAYLLGIAFQYFTIVPIRGLDMLHGLIAAAKADTLSLTAWQLGMYLWMAVVHFKIFGEIPKTDPVFWFMMQIAMLGGFVTAYPVNWRLVRSGLKEKM
jgi:Domain of unknown function (DUF4396)